MVRTFAIAVTLVFGAAFGQAQDLDRILLRDKIALQKLQGEVNEALTQSRNLERADPAKSNEWLQEAIAKVLVESGKPVEFAAFVETVSKIGMYWMLTNRSPRSDG